MFIGPGEREDAVAGAYACVPSRRAGRSARRQGGKELDQAVGHDLDGNRRKDQAHQPGHHIDSGLPHDFPDPAGGFAASLLKFGGIFAITQIPLAISEGLLTVLVVNTLTRFNAQELQGLPLFAGNGGKA